MDKTDSKKVLWANVQTLMTDHFGGQNLGLVASEGEFSPANMTRIAAAKTNVGLDLLEKIAGVFKVEPWQLLAPDLGAHLHTLHGTRMVPAYTPPLRVVAPPTKGVGSRAIDTGTMAAAHRPTSGRRLGAAKSKDVKSNKPKK